MRGLEEGPEERRGDGDRPVPTRGASRERAPPRRGTPEGDSFGNSASRARPPARSPSTSAALATAAAAASSAVAAYGAPEKGDARVATFRALLGLDGRAPYSPVLAEAFFALVSAAWRGEFKHIKEDLEKGPCVVAKRRLLEAVDRADAPRLLLSPARRSRLRADVAALPDVPPRAFRHQGKMASGVDFDAAAALLVDACAAAVADHAARLSACFVEFDADGAGGLDVDEFNNLCDAVLGRDVLPPEARLALFQQIEEEVEDGAGDVDGEIENGALFADSILATSCPLATPAACRNYWAEERRFDAI